MRLRRLRHKADTQEISFTSYFEQELKGNGLHAEVDGDDVVVRNPSLAVVNSIWQEAFDAADEYGYEAPSTDNLWVTFSPSGDVLVHTEIPDTKPRFALNNEDVLEASGSIEDVVKELINEGVNYQTGSNNIIKCTGTMSEFNFDGQYALAETLAQVWKKKLTSGVGEHEEQPENPVDQAIFDANMNTMVGDYKIEQLKKQIDQALDDGDQAKFQELTQQYNELLQQRASKGKRLLKRALRLA